MREPWYMFRRSSFFGSFPPGVKWLLIVNPVVFLLSYVGGATLRNHLYTLFGLMPEAAIRSFYVWQVATYLFLHAGPWHLIFNMLTLWMFGTTLEQDWGTRQFLKYYFISGIGARLSDVTGNALIRNWQHFTIRASGALYGLLLALRVLYPYKTLLLSYLFRIMR